MRKAYYTDIPREKFEKVRHLFEDAKKRTRPREVDLYDIFCAIIYMMRTGCQWRTLPHDLPNWKLVYYYWSVWSKPNPKNEGGVSLIEAALKKSGHRVKIVEWSELYTEPTHC